MNKTRVYEPMHELLANIESLCALCGTPGFEEEIAKVFSERLRAGGVDVRIDNLGNVIGRLAGSSGEVSVMLAAHMDEVGLVIQYIDESGFLRIDTNGLVDPRVLPGTAVTIATKQGFHHGIVGTKPSHLLTEDDRKRPIQTADLWIDVGAENRTQVVERGIRIGDPVTYRPNFVATTDGYLFGKALDNRIGLAILLEVVRQSHGVKFPFDLYLVGTVQEEVGGRGARVAAQEISPTIAIVVDTVSATDAVGRPPQATAELGQGPVLRTLDFRGDNQGTIYSRKLRDFLIAVAMQNSFPYQLDIFRTWTDASTIQFAGEGIATQGVFVPRRYSHSPIEVAHTRDIQVTSGLIWQFLCALDVGKVKELAARF